MSISALCKFKLDDYMRVDSEMCEFTSVKDVQPPKNGKVLLARFGSDVSAASYAIAVWDTWEGLNKDSCGYWREWMTDDVRVDFVPTHWSLLPNDPRRSGIAEND